MFVVTPTLEARPSSYRSGINGILHPTALPWRVGPSARCHAAPLELGWLTRRHLWL